jgi:hypothetical protein
LSKPNYSEISNTSELPVVSVTEGTAAKVSKGLEIAIRCTATRMAVEGQQQTSPVQPTNVCFGVESKLK